MTLSRSAESFRQSIRAGTASFAEGPISPIASITLLRKEGSPFFKDSMRSGKAPKAFSSIIPRVSTAPCLEALFSFLKAFTRGVIAFSPKLAKALGMPSRLFQDQERDSTRNGMPSSLGPIARIALAV